MSTYSLRLSLVAAAFATLSSASAIEGIWPLHDVPFAHLEKELGVKIDQAWLDRVRIASGRYGSSSGFVSSTGLIITNHHVAEGCLARLSTPQDNIRAKGFLARTAVDERVCPGAEARVLMSFEDVSSQIAASKTEEARKQVIAKIEAECAEKTKLRCDVVALYRGAQHWVYRYQVYPTVKLVWAPEESVGGYGGDTDNFVYPRYSLDAAIVRAYASLLSHRRFSRLRRRL
jgi:hypothetical protein